MPNNILFLVHYLSIKNPSIPVRSALPATKISPIYLQQQFFQQLKQQLSAVQLNASIKRSPSPNQIRSTRINTSSNNSRNSNTTATNNNNNSNSNTKNNPPAPPPASASTQQRPQSEGFIESSLDVFDSFGRYEAAFYRYSILKPFITRLLETNPQSKLPDEKQTIPEGFEKDLISAIEKKILSQKQQMETYKSAKSKRLEALKEEKDAFWEKYRRLLNGEEVSIDGDKMYENDSFKDTPTFMSL